MIDPLDPSLSQQPDADPQPQPDLGDPAAALPVDQGGDSAANAPQPAAPEETDEAWRLRFLEENAHLAPPPLAPVPAPPPMPWDGPSSSWKVPGHLSMPHPNGGYMAMALLSRTMDDLDEATGGKRAATYEEVDRYFGHALIAEGLVPRTATPEEAIRWWKAGGYEVLRRSTADHSVPSADRLPPDLFGEQPTHDERRPAPAARPMNPSFTVGEDLVQPQGGAPATTPYTGRELKTAINGQASTGLQATPNSSAGQINAPTPATPKSSATDPKSNTPVPKGEDPYHPILGTVMRSKSNVPNRIAQSRLSDVDLIDALDGGLLSSLEPDVSRAGGGITGAAQLDQKGKVVQSRPAIANVDVSADHDAVAFANAIASSLTAAKVGGKRQLVEKYLMVEWDSSSNRYIVTGIKVLPDFGGYVGDLSPVLPETLLAIKNKIPPRAFVIHTHIVDATHGELPGGGDGAIPKLMLMPNITISANGTVYETTLRKGELDNKKEIIRDAEVSVLKIFKNGSKKTVPPYPDMPK